MLNEREEAFLRQQLRDSTPMQSVNPVPSPPRYEDRVTPPQIEKWLKAPKLQPVSINADQLVQDKLRGADFKGSPGEFFATVGVGRAELVKMSSAEIRDAIARAATRDDDVAPPRAMIGLPKPVPASRGPAIVMVGD